MSTETNFNFEFEQDELCRINVDGTVIYDWPLIEATAAKWHPFEMDGTVCLTKLLLPLKPEEQE